jgi:hypothetical protein
MDTLRAFPQQIRDLIARAPQDRLAIRAKDGTFAMVEQVWHLADLEVEGYGARIVKMLSEDDPELPDFRGDVVAEERNYRGLDVREGLDKFAAARAANLALIARLTDEQRQRTGRQEGVGRVTVARVVEMMGEHDAGHAAELHALLLELTT